MTSDNQPPAPEPSNPFGPDEATLRRDRNYAFAAIMLYTLLMICIGLLTGCTTTGQALNCAGWKAIYPSRQDHLTQGTKRQILAHNEFGVAQKCWPEP